MFANNDKLFVMLNAKSDALGDLTATTASTNTFAGAGIAGGHAAGLAVATAFAEGTTAAAPPAPVGSRSRTPPAGLGSPVARGCAPAPGCSRC